MRIGIFILFSIVTATAARWQKCPSFSAKDICAIKFVSASDGWIMTKNEIWKTADSGKTWMDSKVPVDSGAYFTSSFFLDKKWGWAMAFGSSRPSHIVTTSDGGINWSNDTTQVKTISSDLFFQDSLRGWYCGGAIYYTDNGGLTWSQQLDRSASKEFFSSIYFVDTKIGFASGSRVTNEQYAASCTVIYRTLDGGTSWECVYVASDIDNYPVPELHTINFVNADEGFFWVRNDFVMIFTSKCRPSFLQTIRVPLGMPRNFSNGTIIRTIITNADASPFFRIKPDILSRKNIQPMAEQC